MLQQALDPRHPLLERVKFLSIVASNLDEFFMVRVATLLKKSRGNVEDVSPDGLDTTQQLAVIRKRTDRMMEDMAACWAAVLRPLLADRDIRFLERAECTEGIRDHLRIYFHKNIHPVLTPLALDSRHPFPFISNLSMNLAVVVRHDGQTRFVRVKLPDVLPRFVPVPETVSAQPGDTFVFLEDVVKERTSESTMPSRVVNIMVENFEIEEDVVKCPAERMGYGDWLSLTGLRHPQLKDRPFSPRRLWSEADVDTISDEIANGRNSHRRPDRREGGTLKGRPAIVGRPFSPAEG